MSDQLEHVTVDEALAELPGTPNEVAAFLLVEGVDGARCSSITCPIATWLVRRTGRVILVDRTYAYAYHHQVEPLRVLLPHGARAFVTAFDDGLYPSLRTNVADPGRNR